MRVANYKYRAGLFLQERILVEDRKSGRNYDFKPATFEENQRELASIVREAIQDWPTQPTEYVGVASIARAVIGELNKDVKKGETGPVVLFETVASDLQRFRDTLDELRNKREVIGAVSFVDLGWRFGSGKNQFTIANYFRRLRLPFVPLVNDYEYLHLTSEGFQRDYLSSLQQENVTAHP